MTPQELQLSQYKIVRRLGAGGMAEVFLADKVGAAGFSRRVAIKTILAGNAPKESISLFLDEARVASFLQHSGIVQTLDLGFEADTLFIAMEYVAGPTLSRLVYDLKRMGGLLPWPIVAYIGARVANALDYAHRRATDTEGQSLSLVHRDISPQNILVTRDGIVKLTDFGVARASIQMHKTKTGQVRGKAAYMAPEQVRAKTMDGRTDMFALGLVLYEALTGHRPFQRKADIQSMRAVLGDTPPPIVKRNSTVPKELVDIIDRCIQKDPDKRFSHCGELEGALRASYSIIRESDITDKITGIMSDVFGTQTWDKQTDQEPVEAWHPTIQVDEHGKVQTPRLKRLEDTEMSQEIADLLGQTPSQARTGEMTPVSSPTHQDLIIPRLNSDLGNRAEALVAATPQKLGIARDTNVTPMPPEAYQTPGISLRAGTKNRRGLIYVIGALVFTATLLFFLSKKLDGQNSAAISVEAQKPSRPSGFKAVPGKATAPTNPKPETVQRPKFKPEPKRKQNKVKAQRNRSNSKQTKKEPKDLRPEVKPSKPAEPKPVPIDLGLVLDLVERAEKRENKELKEQLETVIFKLNENQPLNTTDRKLVRHAQKIL